MDVLDRTLDDGVLEAWEVAWLADTATAVGISEQGRAELHASYYDKLVERILADGLSPMKRRRCPRWWPTR